MRLSQESTHGPSRATRRLSSLSCTLQSSRAASTTGARARAVAWRIRRVATRPGRWGAGRTGGDGCHTRLRCLLRTQIWAARARCTCPGAVAPATSATRSCRHLAPERSTASATPTSPHPPDQPRVPPPPPRPPPPPWPWPPPRLPLTAVLRVSRGWQAHPALPGRQQRATALRVPRRGRLGHIAPRLVAPGALQPHRAESEGASALRGQGC